MIELRRGGVETRHFTDRLRIDAADVGHLLGRECLDPLGKLLEAFGVRLHVLRVVQFLLR